jgi:choline monooxygenase
MSSLRETVRSFDPELPLEKARTIPAEWYFDPEILALEKQAIFGDTWQMVGRAETVARPGCFLTADVAGEPVLVVRDEQGTLRAFPNVCRHRAALVVTEPCGCATRLRCRYHGWTYDLEGRLRGVPEFDGVADFRREDNGLPPLAVAEWGPWVWTHLGQQPPVLAEWLTPLAPRLAGALDALRFVERREYELACNWKVFVDNYLDGGYHINTVHPGLANVLDYSRYHTEMYPEASVQVGPLVAPHSDEGESVSRVRTGGEVQYWWLFPNLMINVTGNVMDTNLVLPLGPERCRVLFDFFFSRTEADSPSFTRDSIAVSHAIQLEDAGICEEVQRGLASRSYSTGRFSVRREGPGYHFHQLLGRRLREAV